MTKPSTLSPSERKARQREKMRAWILKQTSGKITTAEGYVMHLMNLPAQADTNSAARQKAVKK